MANIGEAAEIVNASELKLMFSTDTYITCTNLVINVQRPEDRVATTDAGPLYTYGKGNNNFTATLVLTVPEMLDTNAVGFNQLSQLDTSGAGTSRAWIIKGEQIDGNDTVSWACTGILRDYQVRKDDEGKVMIDIFVRITGDTVAVT
jgi:hypothetical protein